MFNCFSFKIRQERNPKETELHGSYAQPQSKSPSEFSKKFVNWNFWIKRLCCWHFLLKREGNSWKIEKWCFSIFCLGSINLIKIHLLDFSNKCKYLGFHAGRQAGRGHASPDIVHQDVEEFQVKPNANVSNFQGMIVCLWVYKL